MKRQTKTKNHNKDVPNVKNKQHGHGDLDHLANEIDAFCRSKLPDGKIQGGILYNQEPAIRQNAILMVWQGFLAGNPRYAMAKEANDSDAASFELERSASIAMRHCKARLADELAPKMTGHILISERNGGICQHPANQTPNDWPHSVRINMAMRGLEDAVRTKKLSPANYCIAAMIINDGKTVEEVAKALGVTRAAVNQQLHRVRRIMPGVIERIEQPSFPW